MWEMYLSHTRGWLSRAGAARKIPKKKKKKNMQLLPGQARLPLIWPVDCGRGRQLLQAGLPGRLRRRSLNSGRATWRYRSAIATVALAPIHFDAALAACRALDRRRTTPRRLSPHPFFFPVLLFSFVSWGGGLVLAGFSVLWGGVGGGGFFVVSLGGGAWGGVLGGLSFGFLCSSFFLLCFFVFFCVFFLFFDRSPRPESRVWDRLSRNLAEVSQTCAASTPTRQKLTG